ncbi:hypothetical protein OX283_010910 [Flavobacterium sp. SUN052]|uniref:hypothetical protein n=1 Tax=Flavobacterium sp. SUN052 TaxID=3002441 RepID=UPI00237DD067|nr:hypothetical protein [Flavobacterium sp. SUN052]MEC4005168.1 hypothetical protein [Flavobacterium sp. SUN052]
MKKYNLIYLKSGMMLSKKQFESWEDIQAFYEDYMASLNFETIENVNEYLSLEYKLEKEIVEKLTENIYLQENEIELVF